MLFPKKIRPDSYLKKFLEYSKEKYRDNLTAIIIYGSYACGYFNKKKSDYDIIAIFKENAPNKKAIGKQFKKISLQYSLTENHVIENAHLGHFTSYITILKGGRILYKTKELSKLLKKLKATSPLDKAIGTAVVEAKSLYLKKELIKRRGFNAVKWALPSIRKRLQLLTFIKRNKLIWKLNKNLKFNKDILAKEEISFIKNLNKKLLARSNKFSKQEKQSSIKILDKINKEILHSLTNLI